MNKRLTVFILSACCLICLPCSVCSQTPAWAWANSAGGNDNEVAYGLATDPWGCVIVAGYFKSPSITFGNTSLVNQGSADVFLVKYDAAGNVIWAKSAGSSDDDAAKSVAVDADGNILLTGFFTGSSITFGNTVLTNTSATFRDVFIVKYDTSGNVLWAKSAGGVYHDEGASVAFDRNDNALLTGFFLASTIAFGTDTLYNAGNYDMFFVKYDPYGNVLSAGSEGGNKDDRGYCITADSMGNIIVAGAFQSDSLLIGNDVLHYAGGAYSDIFLIKYDSAGNPLWAEGPGGTYLDEPDGIAVDASGNIYMTGIVYSDSIQFGTDVLYNSGYTFYGDLFVVKYSPAGLPVWARGAGAGSNNDWGSSVLVRKSGDILLAGYFGSSIDFDTITLNNAGVFVVQYDTAGHAAWAKEVPGGVAYAIASGPDDNICTAGYFYAASVVFGNTTLNNAGSLDAFVAKMQFQLSVSASQMAVTCHGACDGSAYCLAQGGTPPYTYLWDANTGNQTSATATGLCAGTYTVTVFDNDTSSEVAVVLVTEPSPLSLNMTSNAQQTMNCDGNATAIPAGGTQPYTYAWDANTNNQTTQTATALCSGWYLITVADSNSCSLTDSVFVDKLSTLDDILKNGRDLSLFPNPAGGRILISLSHAAKVEVYDDTGRLVITLQKSKTHFSLDVSDWSSGLYILKVDRLVRRFLVD